MREAPINANDPRLPRLKRLFRKLGKANTVTAIHETQTGFAADVTSVRYAGGRPRKKLVKHMGRFHASKEQLEATK